MLRSSEQFDPPSYSPLSSLLDKVPVFPYVFGNFKIIFQNEWEGGLVEATEVAPKVEHQQQQQKDDDLQLMSIEDENTENLSEHEKSDSEQEKDCPTRPESDKSDSDSEGVKETTVKTTEETASIEPHSALPNAMEEGVIAAGDSVPAASPPKVRRSAGERRTAGHSAAAAVDKNSRREKSAEKPAQPVPGTPASKGAGKVAAAAVVSVTALPSTVATTGTPAKRSFASTVKNTVSAVAATSAGVKMCSSAAFGRAAPTDTTAGGSQRPRMTRALTTIGTAPAVAKVPSVSRRSQVN